MTLTLPVGPRVTYILQKDIYWLVRRRTGFYQCKGHNTDVVLLVR